MRCAWCTANRTACRGDCRPLCRMAGDSVPDRRGGCVERHDHRCSRGTDRDHAGLRTLGCGCAPPGRAARTGRIGAGHDRAQEVTIVENGLKFGVDFTIRAKDWLYLDQRRNRQRLAAAIRRARHPQLFLLYRGFQRLCPGRRGAQRAFGR